MTQAFKLTDQDGYTRRGETGETLWTVGATVLPTGEGDQPCGPGVLHAYCSPEVAVLGNPLHADIKNPRLFRIEADAWETDGLKRWTTGAVCVLEELPLPVLTTEELVAWAIVLAPHTSTRPWAVRRLSGDDRSAESAARAEWAAVESAEWAESAARVAARAARAATRATAAAESAARVAAAESAARAARAADAGDAESRLMPALNRARAILAGAFPAERYDEPL